MRSILKLRGNNTQNWEVKQEFHLIGVKEIPEVRACNQGEGIKWGEYKMHEKKDESGTERRRI